MIPTFYLVILLFLALALYQPWRAKPLGILDFSEFLPLLQESDSYVAGLKSLASYYAAHGRFAVLTYAFITANWVAFGLETAGWEWLGFALPMINVILVFLLLQRLRQSPFASALGAGLFVVASQATSVWIRLTGEPLSLMALLLATIILTFYQEIRRWKLLVGAFVLLGVLAVASKETSIVALPILAVFGCVWDGRGGLHRLRLTSRNLVLLRSTAVTVGLLGLVLFLGSSRLMEDAYALSYGEGSVSLDRFLIYLLIFLLPSQSFNGLLASGPNVLVILLVFPAWILRLGSTRETQLRLTEIALLIALPAFGVAVYLPWPRLELFYAYPFLLGTACILATAVSRTERLSRSVAVAVRVVGVALITLLAVQAGNHARRAEAVRQLDWEVAHSMPRLPNHDLMLVAVPRLAVQEWQGQGATLRRFSIAIGAADGSLPPARDIPCSELSEIRLDGEEHVVLLSYTHLCGSLSDPILSLSRKATQLDEVTLRSSTITHQADFKSIRVAKPKEAGKRIDAGLD